MTSLKKSSLYTYKQTKWMLLESLFFASNRFFLEINHSVWQDENDEYKLIVPKGEYNKCVCICVPVHMWMHTCVSTPAQNVLSLTCRKHSGAIGETYWVRWVSLVLQLHKGALWYQWIFSLSVHMSSNCMILHLDIQRPHWWLQTDPLHKLEGFSFLLWVLLSHL